MDSVGRLGRIKTCQFSDDEPCADYKGESYCAWHLPLEAKALWQETLVEAFHAALRKHLEDLDARNATADFAGVQFPGDTYFEGLSLRDADFREAAFAGCAMFSGTTLAGVRARFQWATFGGVAIFDHARFASYTSFYAARFHDFTSFRHATFGVGDQLLTEELDAELASSQLLGPAGVYGKADFGAPDNSERWHFGKSTWCYAVFQSTACFQNRVFTEAGDFSEARFRCAPIFHGCKFHEAMTFPDEGAFGDVLSEGAAQAYRTLRLGMEKLTARHEAGMFYALEQESLCNTPGRMKPYERALSRLYGCISDYGRNALTPIAWLFLCVFPVFAVVYAVMTSPVLDPAAAIDSGRVWHSATFSLQQIAQPLWVWRNPTTTMLFEGEGNSPLWLAWIASFQALLSIALVALCVLALRWRFKRE
jgi:uncharacterized protein YjbI with pentapeptide repeats